MDGSLMSPHVAQVRAVANDIAAVGTDNGAELDDAARVEMLRALEELKAAAAAAQVRVTAAFVASQRAAQQAAGVPAARLGRGVAAQVGLALRMSPFRAQRYTGRASVLVDDLPRTLACLARGATTEWRAMVVARETRWLSPPDRRVVDAQLADRLPQLGDRRVEAEVKTLAYRLDPHGYLDQIRGAEADRHVSTRPAPDTMCRLSALLPVAQGVAAYAALRAEADTRIGAGDPRNRGQLMADTLVQRLTGQATAQAVPVEIELLMTDTGAGDTAPPTGTGTSTGASPKTAGRDEPAQLIGYGPVPAGWARELALAPDGPRWLRRLYRAPSTGELAALDSRRRLFTDAQRRFIRLRDRTCRTPWCDAPIRHTDHIQPADHGGPTTVTNGQGYCQACNHAKQAPGWSAVIGENGAVTTATPTRHRYRSRPPDLPGTPPPEVGPPQQPRIDALVRSRRLAGRAA